MECQVNQFLISSRKAIQGPFQFVVPLITQPKKDGPFCWQGHIVPHHVSNHGKRRLLLPKSYVIVKAISENLQKPWQNGILIRYLWSTLTKTEGYILVNILCVFSVPASRSA
jgi:hypothetical protein